MTWVESPKSGDWKRNAGYSVCYQFQHWGGRFEQIPGGSLATSLAYLAELQASERPCPKKRDKSNAWRRMSEVVLVCYTRIHACSCHMNGCTHMHTRGGISWGETVQLLGDEVRTCHTDETWTPCAILSKSSTQTNASFSQIKFHS